jgi:hypothetical protein
MPKFVIERQYLLPIYQRLIVDAPDIATACQEAVENDDWESAEEDGDGSGATTISAAREIPEELLEQIERGNTRAYARRAVRRRFKRRRDEWAETISEWRDRTASLPRYTPAERRIAVCPATYSDATCKTCGACARVRDAVIGFPAHGAWRRVESAIAARSVSPGESWAFQEHRTMAEVIAEETAAA